MKKMVDVIGQALAAGFAACGYDEKLGTVTVSNRPDLCQFQCNGALAAAKLYKKAPIMIANEVIEKTDKSMFSEITAIMPGFINIKLNSQFLAGYIQKMSEDERYGYEAAENPLTIVIDYGGPNVAKPLHVGHLRSAGIGESVKRICRFAGHKVIGDVHFGDWGMPMGLIIEELKDRKPDLCYFDENYEGEYPEEAPFTISELEEIYPAASLRSKSDEEFKERAHKATALLQSYYKPYYALWKHIMKVSVADIKRNFDKLGVDFDIWKGESDAEPYIDAMVQDMLDKKLAYESQGALVVDIREEGDTKEFPPCIIRKSDGAATYQTTDLATLVDREKNYNPDRVIYLADKRQELHFLQVFRTAKKAGIVRPDTKLDLLGFGTVNNSDGKPFKTRDGGVMRLEALIDEINESVYKKMMDNRDTSEEDAREKSKIVGKAALKYADLSNQASKDYIFDIDKFASFEGNTGPYILYTMVRIKSILAKYEEVEGKKFVPVELGKNQREYGASEFALMLSLASFNEMCEKAYEELAPHKICQYIYELANNFNSFYHENKIMTESDTDKKNEWISLILLVLRVLEKCIDLLGFEAPDRM